MSIEGIYVQPSVALIFEAFSLSQFKEKTNKHTELIVANH